jgi:hypothetical protein
MEDQNEPNQVQDGLDGQVMESDGSENAANDESQAMHEDGDKEGLPKGVKDRLWRQERKHQREIRDMRSQLDGMHQRMNSQPHTETPEHTAADYAGQHGVGIDEQIHKAVSYALRAKEDEERKARDMAQQHHIQKKYQELNKHLDDTSDKYDDFEEKVRGEGVNFTPHMRDAALLLPRKGPGSAGEVLYKLGNNQSELDRISRLPSVDQASELIALSHALIKGEDIKSGTPSRPLGQIKSNPVMNSLGVTEKTSPSAIRALMKAGKFK